LRAAAAMRLYFGENTKDGKFSHLLTLFTPLVDVAVLVAPDSTLSGGFEPVTELVTLKLSDCTSNAGEVLPLALPSPTNSLPGLPIALCNSKNMPRSRFWTGARRAGSPHRCATRSSHSVFTASPATSHRQRS
jgi:hypothetical protein